jgi:hypothetical protein
MTEDMFRVVLETANAKADGKDGWATLPEGRLMTLHAAHDGVPLSVAKVEAVKVHGGVVRAKSAKGETIVAMEDLFAAAFEGGGDPTNPTRKAGFLG